MKKKFYFTPETEVLLAQPIGGLLSVSPVVSNEGVVPEDDYNGPFVDE